MADVQAFRAYRYDLARVGELSDVIAPPYDVIDPALQDALYGRSPYNVIRLILNKETPADSETSNRYTRAGQTLRDWQSEGILTQDSARSLYVSPSRGRSVNTPRPRCRSCWPSGWAVCTATTSRSWLSRITPRNAAGWPSGVRTRK